MVMVTKISDAMKSATLAGSYTGILIACLATPALLPVQNTLTAALI